MTLRTFEELLFPAPLFAEDPPQAPPDTEDSSKSGSLPTPGAEEPLD